MVKLHKGMTGDEIMAELRKRRMREIERLRALARHYNAEADRIEQQDKETPS